MLGSGVAVEGRKGDPIDVSISREIRLQPFFAMCVRQSGIPNPIGTGLGYPPRNFSRQTPLHAAELIAFQRIWSPSVGTVKLSDQQHALAEHRAMRSSPAPKHDACAVVSEDTIAKAAAESHADGESSSAARRCCPQHRQAPPCSAVPQSRFQNCIQAHASSASTTPAMPSTMQHAEPHAWTSAVRQL